MKPLHCTILASIGGVFAALAMGLPAFAFFLPYGAAAFLIGLSVGVGMLAFPAERPGIRAAFGFFGALALVAVFGAGVYYAYALDAVSVSCLMIVLPWLVFSFSPFLRVARHQPAPELLDISQTPPVDTVAALFFLMSVGFDLIALRWLLGAATVEAIRSPWDVVHPLFFLWFFLASFSLIALCYRNRYHHLSLGAVAFHLFTALSPALLVYAIGFGFDPFIHIATEKLIVTAGSVTPKPPYYLGQYAVVSVFARIFRLPVETVDRILVPGLASVYLPMAAVYLLRRGYKLERHLAILGSLAVLTLPLATFTATTPQGLANVFALTTVVLGACWLHDHRPALPYLLLTAAAALSIHPLSGMPALLFVLFAVFFKLRQSRGAAGKLLKALAWALLFAAAAAAVPALFAVNAALTSGSQTLNLRALAAALSRPWAPGTLIPSRFSPFLDFVQMTVSYRAWLIIALAAVGGAILARKTSYRRTLLASASIGAATLAGALILKTGISVPGVIGYEQENYGNRLIEVALLTLTPLVLAGSAWWWRNLRRTDASVRVIHILLFAALMTAFAYAAFPRHDAFETSRGYSVSRHDLNAVREIDQRARDAYIVLADQSVSAAAVREFGFRSYYHGQFFYPIPTGGPLYGYYLDMVYKRPDRETMNAAMRSVGIEHAFFAVNDYWINAPTIIEAAKKTADGWFEVDGGKLTVFEYFRR